jgi:hypothetical protein
VRGCVTQGEQLAAFAVRAMYDAPSTSAREALRARVLDSLGCAIGAVGGEPVQLVRAHVGDFGRRGRATLIGGGRTAPDHAALYNGPGPLSRLQRCLRRERRVLKCQRSRSSQTSFQLPTPGKNASIRTTLLTSAG